MSSPSKKSRFEDNDDKQSQSSSPEIPPMPTPPSQTMADMTRRFNTFMSKPGVVLKRGNDKAAKRAEREKSVTPQVSVTPYSSLTAVEDIQRRITERTRREAESYASNGLVERINDGNAYPGLVMLGRLQQRLARARSLRPPGQAVPEVARNAPVQQANYNPPPTGKKVNTLEQLRSVPNSHMVQTVGDLTVAISLDTTEDGLNNYGIITSSFRVILLSSSDPTQIGLDLLNGPARLIEVIFDLLNNAVDHSVQEANAGEDEPRELQISLGNLQVIDREVASGIYLDTPENRIVMVRALLDQLLVTSNSSDLPTSFQELAVAITVRFPNRAINDLAGDGHRPDTGSGPYLPFGIRLHKAKSMTKKTPKGQLLFVRSEEKCWAVALFLGITHWMLKRQIEKIEAECRSTLSATQSGLRPTWVEPSQDRSASSSRSTSPFTVASSSRSSSRSWSSSNLSSRSSSPILSFPLTEDGTLEQNDTDTEPDGLVPSPVSSEFTPPDDMYPAIATVDNVIPAIDLARLKVVNLQNQLYQLVAQSGQEQLDSALEFFEGVGININNLVAEEETFNTLAKALSVQIIILDEASDYQNVKILPSRVDPETNAVVYVYDETRINIYLLRILYPGFDESDEAEDYYHYHALVSPNALLYSQLKRICLYCRRVFCIRWTGHACKEKKKTSCNSCLRVEYIDLDPDDILGEDEDSLYAELHQMNFCFRKAGDREKFQCPKCKQDCASQTCRAVHLKTKMCKTSSICTKCGQRFACVGNLAPTKEPITDAHGKVTGEKSVLPTAHINCLHSYCMFCNIWDDAREHICRTKKPKKATKIPPGLGSLHMEFRRHEEGKISIEAAGLCLHADRFARKDVDWILLTDLAEDFDGKKTNMPHRCPDEYGFKDINYLEPSTLMEGLKHPPGSKSYVNSPELKCRWNQLRSEFVDERDDNPCPEATWSAKVEMAEFYLYETQNYVRGADMEEMRKIQKNLTRRSIRRRRRSDEASAEDEEEEEEDFEKLTQLLEQDDAAGGFDAHDHDGLGYTTTDSDVGEVSTIQELLATVGIDRESTSSFLAFGGNRPEGDNVDKEEEEEEEEVEDNIEVDGDKNIKRRSVGSRLIHFFCQPHLQDFVFLGMFDSTAEGAAILRESLIIGIPVKGSFQGRKVASVTFPLTNVKLVNLRSYLPTSLFKMAKAFKFHNNWTWFPSREIVRQNMDMTCDTIPDISWWRSHDILDPLEKEMFERYHNKYEGPFLFNLSLVNHVHHRALLIMKIAMAFSHETMVMENNLLEGHRAGLLAGKFPVIVNGEEVHVINNHPLSTDFFSFAGYSYWLFNRASTLRLPILQYDKKFNPTSRSSFMELAYLEWMRKTNSPTLQFSLNSEQKLFITPEGSRVYVDGFVPGVDGSPDRIIEINGCYHHSCSTCFPHGSPLQRLQKGSILTANVERKRFLSQHGTVEIIWSHDIALKLKKENEFSKFYKSFAQNDFDSFGWREGHTTGVVEPYGIFADADSIAKWMKNKWPSESSTINPVISQVDMNSNYGATLMDIHHPNAIKQSPIPIPMDGMKTLFAPRIWPRGSCPESCWRSKCARAGEPGHGDQSDECTIIGCLISCELHFNSDFFESVSGMAKVKLLAPRDLMYPITSIPVEQDCEETEGVEQEGEDLLTIPSPKQKVDNYYALCRQCAIYATGCKMGHHKSANLRGADSNADDGEEDVHEIDCDFCDYSLNFYRGQCDHDVEERAFNKVVPLNELAYLLEKGYRIVKYYAIRYFSKNVSRAYHEYMLRISRKKILARGIPSELTDTRARCKFLRDINVELSKSGPQHVIEFSDFSPNPVLEKLYKMVSCLTIGKLAKSNDRSFNTIVQSHNQFMRLVRDPLLTVVDYYLLNSRTLLVSCEYAEGGDRSMARSGCLLLSSMITAAARVNMFKYAYKILEDGYLTLYLGVDSLIVVPYEPRVKALEEVLPINGHLSGLFSYQHKDIANVVAFGRNRYSVMSRSTRQVEFKWAGLSGIRNASLNDKILCTLHSEIANVLMTETKKIRIPQARVEISKKYDDIRIQDEVYTVKDFHIVDIKRQFMSEGVLRNYSFETKSGIGQTFPLLYPLVFSLPLGYCSTRTGGNFFAEKLAYLMLPLCRK